MSELTVFFFSKNFLLQIYAVSITIRIVVSTKLHMKLTYYSETVLFLFLIYFVLFVVIWQFGFMFIALIWKYDFAPFMVLIIAILNDGELLRNHFVKNFQLICTFYRWL